MNAPDRFLLPDTQVRTDLRKLAIQKVGVKALRYPLTLLDARGGLQHTLAQLTMSVGLPREVKGTHISRFVEVLERKHVPLNIKSENFESIHNHSAYAEISGKNPDGEFA